MFIGNLKLAREENKITINTEQITWFTKGEWETGITEGETGITEVHMSDGECHYLEIPYDDFSRIVRQPYKFIPKGKMTDK